MRYIGSGLALLTLVILAFAGQIDNSATRSYVDAKIADTVALIPSTNGLDTIAARVAADLAGSNGVPAAVGLVMSTGTTFNASNLGNVPAAQYAQKTNSHATTWSDATNLTITAASGEYLAWQPTGAVNSVTFDLSTYPTNETPDVSLSVCRGTNTIWWNTASISTNTVSTNMPGSASFVLSTNLWHRFVFGRAAYSTNVMSGVQIH